jgi:phosphoenolpyruvate synthase/pyruvate phosphate dikinase
MADPEFRAPGPGVWELEQTHFAKPATRYIADMFPDALSRGFGEGTKRFGLLLDTLRMKTVNDFCYAKFCPVGAPEGAKGPPPKFIFKLLTRLHPEIRRRIKDGALAFEKKLWREEMKRWDEQFKPDSIARNSKLQRTPIEKLADTEFIKYLGEIRENAAEMVYRHHIFTIPSSMPVGHFIVETRRWTGLSSGEVLGVLKGSAPISRGVARNELGALQAALKSAGISADSYRGKPAQAVLDDLKSKNGVGDTLAQFLDSVAYRMVSGYDIAEKYALELPDMLVKTIFSGAADSTDRKADFERRRDALREKVPQADRAKFDELLEEARFMHRLRDERGMYNDLWGSGLARRALLEAGRRLKDSGAIPEADLAVYANHNELVALLKGEKTPTAEELARRRTWRETKTIADAPAYLGGEPSGPPPAEWLPRKAQANARAIDTIIREIFDASTRKNGVQSVEGIPVHPGVYEGPARIVKGPEDFDRLQKGDVLVARTTGPAFNVVLPLLGAIVTDRGGQLSHAAIVAREYGIPAVVGTREATTKFSDGARVRVDGDKGVVEMLT